MGHLGHVHRRVRSSNPIKLGHCGTSRVPTACDGLPTIGAETDCLTPQHEKEISLSEGWGHALGLISAVLVNLVSLPYFA